MKWLMRRYMNQSKILSETGNDNSVSFYSKIDASSADDTHPDQLEFDFEYEDVGSSCYGRNTPYDMIKKLPENLPDDMFEELLIDMVKINHASEMNQRLGGLP